MRRLIRPLTLLSLAANLLLAWNIWSARSTPPAPNPAPTEPAVAQPPNPPAPPLGVRVESADPATFVAQLRAIGLPRPLINAIVSARLRAAFYQRTLAPKNPTGNYWTSRSTSTPSGIQQFIREQAEVENLLSQILGPDYNTDPKSTAEALRRFGPIAPSKIAQVEAINRDYRSMLISYQTSSIRLPGDADAIALLHQEQQADLAILLTPAELFEYNLRNDDTVGQLRSRLRLLQTNEQEFRQIYPLWAALTTAHPADPTTLQTAANRAAETAARQALIDQATVLLGAERAADLAQALNTQATMENNFAARLGLPASTARTLYESRVESMELLEKLKAAESNPENKAALIPQAQAIINRVTTILGPENAQIFERSTGSWLRPLRRTAPPPGG